MVIDTPAVVIGAGLNGLGVVRSLARAGVPVWLLDSDERRVEMHTRHAKTLKIGALHGQTLVEDLQHLGRSRFPGKRPVLFLTQEESVRTVSLARDQLSAFYCFSLPPASMVDTLQHKEGFQRLAEQLGCPIPPLVHIRGTEDLPSLETLRYPVVVKPGERNAEYGKQFAKAYRIGDPGNATELIRRILAVMTDVVVQEWTEGPDSNIYFCLQYLDREGKVSASFTGRKVRSWPPQVGGTASCIPAPEAHGELSALTARFFRDANVIGMAGMEFKRDARNGEFRMVEPTIGRTDYQAEVATLNDVNLPHAAYCAELDLPWAGSGPSTRSWAWRVRSDDDRSAIAQHQRLGVGFECVDGVRDALWRWTDPAPFLVQSMRRIRRALHARLGKLTPASRETRSNS